MKGNMVETVGGGRQKKKKNYTHEHKPAGQAWPKTETCLLQSVFLPALSPLFSFSSPNRKINVKPRGTIVWTSNQELSLLSLPWH